ncbi:hypothetical protein Pelo_1629 [Pelomyxa schiedti]|nr:hypothetical protein Pelo_1629 [Pelomyxa schiedti]
MRSNRGCKNSCAVCDSSGNCKQCVTGAVFPEFGCLTESTPNNLTAIFEAIYEKKKWGLKGGLSGAGSEMKFAIFTIEALQDLTLHLNMRRLWDASCGSMVWMPIFLHSMEEKYNITIEYFGTDAVRSLILDHREKFAHQSHWHFAFLDFTRRTLDIEPPPDVVLIRDTLFHLPNDLIKAAFRSAEASGAKWLLITNNHLKTKNIELANQTDPYRPVNVILPPFCVQKPFKTYVDGPPSFQYRELWLLPLPIRYDPDCLAKPFET